jgi:hypothetical protein
MSYKEYVQCVLLPDNADDKALKAKRQKKISEFLDWLQAEKHPLKEKVFDLRDKLKLKFLDPITNDLKFTVFQSFYELMQYLRSKQMRFVVLLRTFGNDLKEVSDEISNHPLGVKITRRPKFVNKQLHLEGNTTVEKADKIFETFLESEEHFAIQDNWNEWNRDGERARSGKPFFYDASGRWHNVSNLSLFFDDNFTGQELDILNPIEASGNQMPTQELKDKMLFTVNPIEAVLEDDYYVKLVKRALSNL